MLSRSPYLLPLALAVACTASIFPPIAETDSVTAEYVTYGGTWNTGGGISAVVRVYPREGSTLVCGAWTTDRQSTMTVELNEDVVSAASAFMGKTRLVHGLRFMRRVEWADNISGAQANCVLSKVAWQPEFAETEPVLRFPRMVFPDTDVDVDDGVVSVHRNDRVFRQTPRPDIAR